MRILIAGGGTGGHVYPALAVARALRDRLGDPEFRWVGGHRGLEGQVVPASGIPLTLLFLRSLRTVDVSIAALTDPLRLGASFPQAMAILAGFRPAAIFTTGGYVAMPIAAAANLLRIPVVLWEGNVVPGRSSRVVARLSRLVAVSYAPTVRALRRPAYVTGTPIRDLERVDRLAAREHFEIAAGQRCVLIFGGSQSVRRFDEAVEAVLPELLERAAVVHVTGDQAYGPALARRERLPAALIDRYRPYPFLREEMASALAAADIVVGRSGASTLAEVTAMGTPLVVVPYPHAAGHQAANARIVADAGAALLIPDEAFDGRALLEAITALSDPRRHVEMSAASRALGRPGAAAAVASLVVSVAQHRPLPSAEEIDALSRGVAA